MKDLSTLSQGKTHSLEELVVIAQKHPIFKRYLNELTISSFSDIPITNKNDLLQFLAEASNDLYQNAYISPSGATGGKSVYFPVKIQENHYYRELFVEHLRLSKVLNSDDIYMNIFFHGQLYRSLEIFNEFAKRVGATVVYPGDSLSNEDVYQFMKQYNCTSIMGPTRRLTDFALFLKNKNETIPLTNIIFAAEPLQKSKFNLLAKVFQTRNIIGIYGSSETGVWAYQDENTAGSNIYYCHSDMVHLEIEPFDSKESLDIGNLIVTNLVRVTKMPTIRFRIGDSAKILSNDNGRISFQLLGRVGKDFLFADGIVSLNEIENSLPKNILEWQIQLSVTSTLKDLLTLRIAAEEIDINKLLIKTKKLIENNPAILSTNFDVQIEKIQMNEFKLSSIGKIIRVVDCRE